MRLRDLALQLSPDDRVPLYLRVVHALSQAIREGRLQPGQALPGTRALAEMLGVNRSTTILAVQQLEAEGWVMTEPSRGTFVLATLPEEALPVPLPLMIGVTHPPPLGFDLPGHLRPLTRADSESIDLSDGVPDASLAPLDAWGKAYQRALQRHGENLLKDDEPMGQALLRRELATWLSERRGLRASPEQILVTRGSRAALTLLCLSLLQAGDGVAVEDPGQPIAWAAIQRSVPIQLAPVLVDNHGLDVDALAGLLEQRRCRMVYLTPQRQFPTTVALSDARRTRLLDLAAEHRIPLVEDDHDSDYAFGDRPMLPLASMDRQGQVIYTFNLGRILAPGLRLGCIVAPVALVERLARVQRSLEWQGDRVMEWAAADLIRDGDLARHLRKARRIYESRMRFLVECLNAELHGAVNAQVPSGGLALWLRINEDLDAAAWIDAARLRGLVLHRPEHFYHGNPRPYTRMGFAQADEACLEEAVRRLSSALSGVKRSAP